jgi:hypothetical protein
VVGRAAGVLDRVLGHLRPVPDAHQLAHVGELHAALAATDALLRQTAAAVDADPAGTTVSPSAPSGRRWSARHARSSTALPDRRPGAAEPGRRLARTGGPRLRRQHHAERDHAALGSQVVDRWRSA